MVQMTCTHDVDRLLTWHIDSGTHVMQYADMARMKGQLTIFWVIRGNI